MKRRVARLALVVGTATTGLHAGCTSFGGEDEPTNPTNPPVADGGSDTTAVDGSPPPEAGPQLDATSDGAPPVPGTCDPATCRYVFVTSATTGGTIGGTNGADLKCGIAANANTTLSGQTFKAWLSTTSVQAASRFTQRKVEYRRLDGVRVATNLDDLVVKRGLENPINVTETGTVLADELVWTGTFPEGTRTGDTCAGWLDSSTAQVGRVGLANAKTSSWTDYMAVPCNTDARLYCIGD